MLSASISSLLNGDPLKRVKPAIHSFLQRVEAADLTPAIWRDPPLATSLSLVIPIYNCEAYLGRLLRSIDEQTTGLRNVQVILVNDGSTDKSGQIAKEWADRHPSTATYLEQPNRGVSAARNAGLEIATGAWISFPDSDDYLGKRYFATVSAELPRREDLMMVAARPVIVDDTTGRVLDAHPTRYRFKAHRRILLQAQRLGQHMQMQVCSAWIRTDLLRKHGLAFDEAVRPTFEDGHLIYNLFLREPLGTILFLSPAPYFSRRRATNSSLLQGSRANRDWYTTQLRVGYLSLMHTAKERLGHVPRYLQRAILYELVARLRHVTDHPERTSFLTKEDKGEFHRLMRQLLRYISPRTIASFELGGMNEEQRVPLLWLYKRQARFERVYFEKYDHRLKLVQLSWYSPINLKLGLKVRVNGATTKPIFRSHSDSTVLDRPYFRRNFAWFPAAPEDTLNVKRGGRTINVRLRGRRAQGSRILDLLALERTLDKPAVVSRHVKALRRYASAPAAVSRYRGCWLFMDSPDRAGDNAEHFYRYVVQAMPQQSCYFVLDKASPDWLRLEAEGFRLLAMNSQEHIAAWLNAKLVALSNLEHFQLWPLPRNEVADLAKAKIVFLQHGIIVHDLSRWTNTKSIDLFVTSTQPEYRSIAAPDSNYRVSAKEVKLTGLPRHDALLAAARPDRDLILVAPTWRRYLVDEADRVGMARGKVPAFANSLFARNWGDLLRSEALRDIALAANKRIVFCPHPHMSMYSADLALPPWVEVIDTARNVSYQQVLGRTSLLITDYSSLAFDAAFLDSAVIYFQFDREEMWASGAHAWEPGYFDYERDGFGPIAPTVAEVLAAARSCLSGDDGATYEARRHAAFAYRDGKNCERLAEAIAEL